MRYINTLTFTFTFKPPSNHSANRTLCAIDLSDSLQPISETSAYPLLPSQVVSVCDLQRLALYWFHAPGLQLDNEVSQQTDQHMEPSATSTAVAGPTGERIQAGTEDACSRPPGAIESSS